MKIYNLRGRVVFEVTSAWRRPSDGAVLYDYKSENGGGCNLPLDALNLRIAYWSGVRGRIVVGDLPAPENG